MTTTFKDSIPRNKIEHETNIPAENQKGVINHKQAAFHFEAAAKNHLEAAKYHESGNHDRAFKSTVLAYGHHVLAGEYFNEDVKHHVL